MTQLYQTKVWQVLLPDGWFARSQYFDCATLFKPDGVGMLHVMVLPSDSELAKFKPGFDEQFSGKLQGFTISTTGKSFIRRWCLSCGSRTLFVKYLCAPTFAENERREVDEILQNMAESDAPAAE
jgi:hypothetical protein